MTTGMDRDLMALMGIEDDGQMDEGLATAQSEEHTMTFAADLVNDAAAKAPEPHARTSTLFASSSSELQDEPLFPLGFRSLEGSYAPGSASTALSPSPFPTTSSQLIQLYPSDSNPFGRSSPGKDQITKPSTSSATRPTFLSPELSPFRRSSPEKVRAMKKKSPREGNVKSPSMFSPTLSPRKPTGSSPYRMAGTLAPCHSRSPPPTSDNSEVAARAGTSASSSALSRTARGLASPMSSLSLKRTNSDPFSDGDSDISPLEDDPDEHQDPAPGIFLNTSIPSEMDIELSQLSQTSGAIGNSSLSLDDMTDVENEGENLSLRGDTDKDGPTALESQSLKASSEQSLSKMRMEMDRLLRTTTLPIKPRVGKKHDLQGLLTTSQSKLEEKLSKSSFSYAGINHSSAPGPDFPPSSPSSSSAGRSKTGFINLDDSDDESEIGPVKSAPQSGRASAKDFLISPRKQRLSSSKLGTLPGAGAGTSAQNRSRSENAGLPSLVSNSVNALFAGDAEKTLKSGPGFLTSPSKAERRGAAAGVLSFNEQIRRRQAKTNLELRRKLTGKAQRAGEWMAPEERMAQHMALEREEDADDEEEGFYTPDKAIGADALGEEDVDQAYCSSGGEETEASIEGSEGEDHNGIGGVDGNEGGLEEDDEVEKEESGDNEEEDEEDSDEDEDEDEEINTVKAKRVGNHRMLIDDEAEVKVVMVDRRRSVTPGSDDDQTDEHSMDEDDDTSTQLGELFASTGQAILSMSGPDSGSIDKAESLPLPFGLMDVVSDGSVPTQVDPRNNAVANLKRLQKREVRPERALISKHEKSAFIEYEAEEEEDEHMGKGGVDYESENDQDEYDLGDGMVDTTVTMDSQDMENVRLLHMKHEQDQHDKEISDLVHGIAAGNLWKRRNGQVDNMDIFDEDDMDGHFRRKKKLKVSEKFEKLADDPTTAAFARALQKNTDDDQIMFLSDPDESHDEADDKEKDDIERDDGNDDEDKDEDEDVDDYRGMLGQGGHHEEVDEEEDEPLNTDRRQETLRMARILRYGGQSSSSLIVDSDLKAQAQPQIAALKTGSSERLILNINNNTGGTTSLSRSQGGLSVEAESSRRAGKGLSQDHPIDEYNDLLQRSKLIRDIMDGVHDPAEAARAAAVRERLESLESPRASSLAFNTSGRVVDRHAVEGVEVDVTVTTGPRGPSRQNSSFLADERRSHFLSAVGEEGVGSRVVVDVNRRKMAFAAPSKSSTTTSGSLAGSLRLPGSSSEVAPVQKASDRGSAGTGTGTGGIALPLKGLLPSSSGGDASTRVRSWMATVETREKRVGGSSSSQLVDFFSQEAEQEE